MKKLIAMLLVMAMLLGLVACGSEPATTEAPQTEPPKTETASTAATQTEAPVDDGEKVTTWRISTGSMTGSNYSTGAAIALMINEKVDGMEGFVQASTGSVDNCYYLEDNEVEIGYCNAATAVEALAGTGSFDKPVNGISSIGAVMIQSMHIIVNNKAGINSIQDLKGKKISVNTMGSGTEIVACAILKELGIESDEFTHIYGSTAEAFEQVRDGDSDCYMSITTTGGANVTDCLSNSTVKLLEFTDEELKKIVDNNPQYMATEIEANTYKNQTNAIKTIASSVLLATRDNISEESVYQFTKAFYENHDFLLGQSALMSPAIPENALKGNPLPLHRGAEKYFKEIGLLN